MRGRARAGDRAPSLTARFRRATTAGGEARDAPRRRQRGRQQRAARDDARDEAEALRLARVEPAAGERRSRARGRRRAGAAGSACRRRRGSCRARSPAARSARRSRRCTDRRAAPSRSRRRPRSRAPRRSVIAGSAPQRAPHVAQPAHLARARPATARCRTRATSPPVQNAGPLPRSTMRAHAGIVAHRRAAPRRARRASRRCRRCSASGRLSVTTATRPSSPGRRARRVRAAPRLGSTAPARHRRQSLEGSGLASFSSIGWPS